MTNRRTSKQAPRTKFVATLGPASRDAATIGALVKAGANVFRINYSHGTHAEHAAVIERARRAAKKQHGPIGILADLQGPKIRVGAMRDDEPIMLARGDELTIVAGSDIAGVPGRIGCTYSRLARDVAAGERLLLDDGLIELKVLAIEGKEVRTRVRFGGALKSHKGINLPGTKLSTGPLTAKDRADLKHALECGVDFVALSFVRSAGDVRNLRRLITKLGGDVSIIAKIERPEAVDDIEAILEVADGIMIARGDLGVEVGAEAVPSLQKHLIQQCVRAAKPVITATQMLESMMERPRPTRAEASDVANAIYDGTSAVMLSGETAAGAYPVRALKTMVQIAARAERDVYEGNLDLVRSASPVYGRRRRPPSTVQESCVRAAASAALDLHAAAVIAFTESGRTAMLVSRERLPMRVIACTTSERIQRKLCLNWGIIPTLIPRSETIADMQLAARRAIRESGPSRKGDRIVSIAGRVHTIGATDTVQILELPD